MQKSRFILGAVLVLAVGGGATLVALDTDDEAVVVVATQETQPEVKGEALPRFNVAGMALPESLEKVPSDLPVTAPVIALETLSDDQIMQAAVDQATTIGLSAEFVAEVRNAKLVAGVSPEVRGGFGVETPEGSLYVRVEGAVIWIAASSRSAQSSVETLNEYAASIGFGTFKPNEDQTVSLPGVIVHSARSTDENLVTADTLRATAEIFEAGVASLSIPYFVRSEVSETALLDPAAALEREREFAATPGEGFSVPAVGVGGVDPTLVIRSVEVRHVVVSTGLESLLVPTWYVVPSDLRNPHLVLNAAGVVI